MDETIAMWTEKLGPTEAWLGRCYEIACAACEKGLVEGTPIYGHWLGFVDENSFFANRRYLPFIQHGWIQNAFAIVDPTRWVFEDAEPYIWFGPLDTPEYDEGGNQWRQANERSCPLAQPGDKEIKGLQLPVPVFDMLPDALHITLSQVFWLANLSLTTLGELAKPVYQGLIKAGYQAAIPLDNRRKVFRQ